MKRIISFSLLFLSICLFAKSGSYQLFPLNIDGSGNLIYNGVSIIDTNGNFIGPGATNATITATSTSASFFPLFVSSSSSGNQILRVGSGLNFNPSTNVLTTTTFSGALSGNATTATTAANLSGTNLTGDVTNSANATTVAKIAGTTVSGTTGITNVVFSGSPTIVTPTITTSITSPAFVSSTANPSTAGVLECANNELCIGFRNAANSSNGTLKLDTSNNIAFGGSLNGMDFGGSILKGVTTLAASSTVTLTGITTGTNADFLCLTAGGVVTLQSSACTISSRRFKEHIRLLTENDGLAQVMKLHPVEFNMIQAKKPNKDINYARTQVGLIAEDVAKVDSRLVVYEQDGMTPKSYRQEAVISMLVKAVQEQQTQITELKNEINQLKR